MKIIDSTGADAVTSTFSSNWELPGLTLSDSEGSMSSLDEGMGLDFVAEIDIVVSDFRQRLLSVASDDFIAELLGRDFLNALDEMRQNDFDSITAVLTDFKDFVLHLFDIVMRDFDYGQQIIDDFVEVFDEIFGDKQSWLATLYYALLVKNFDTIFHSLEVFVHISTYCYQKGFNSDRIEAFQKAALVHDIGKVLLDSAVLELNLDRDQLNALAADLDLDPKKPGYFTVPAIEAIGLQVGEKELDTRLLDNADLNLPLASYLALHELYTAQLLVIAGFHNNPANMEAYGYAANHHSHQITRAWIKELSLQNSAIDQHIVDPRFLLIFRAFDISAAMAGYRSYHSEPVGRDKIIKEVSKAIDPERENASRLEEGDRIAITTFLNDSLNVVQHPNSILRCYAAKRIFDESKAAA